MRIHVLNGRTGNNAVGHVLVLHAGTADDAATLSLSPPLPIPIPTYPLSPRTLRVQVTD